MTILNPCTICYLTIIMIGMICKTKTKEETEKTKKQLKQRITTYCLYIHVQVSGGTKKMIPLSWNMNIYFQ